MDLDICNLADKFVQKLEKSLNIIIQGQVHTGTGHGGKTNRSQRVKWEDVHSVFSGRIRSGVIINIKHIDISMFLNDAFFLFKNRITRLLKSSFQAIKANAVFCGEFIKVGPEEKTISEFKYFNTKQSVIDLGTDLKAWFQDNVIDKILNKIEEFSEKDSGWALHKIVSLEVNINKLEMGNGISSFIRLPEKIAQKHACVNVKNYNDDLCFLWSIISALYPVNLHVDRTASYPHPTTVFNLDGLEFPMQISSISKFEKLNQISVNVYQLKLVGKKISMLHLHSKLERHANLLLIQDKYLDERYEDTFLNNESANDRLVSAQLSKHKGTKHICDICLNYFRSKTALDSHTVNCSKINKCKITFPKENSLSFTNYRYKERVPYILYCDFESMLEPFSEPNNPNQTRECRTSKYQKHTAISAGYYFKCSYDDSLSYYASNRGPNCITWFTDELERISKFIENKLKAVEPMNISELQEHEFAISTHCHICEKPFEAGELKTKDHCHLSGMYRGPAHQKCNLNYKNSFTVPVVSHNLTGYDSHLLIRDLAKTGNVTLLPINKEKYISFTKWMPGSAVKFRFIDSFRFMASSLDTLCLYLKTNELLNLQREFSNLTSEKFKLLTRKGVFPYDYIDCLDKLNETQLPSIDKFYNKLNDSHASTDAYAHAQNVWKSFNIKTLGEYSDLYLKTDVILLADVFENFRQKCLNIYQLDPGHYYTLPGYTWDCALKYTKVELDYLKDVDMLLFMDRGIRGGVSQCSNRYAEANNKLMPTYDCTQPSKYLMYFDVNNLYGWAMCQYLPYGGFEWMRNFENFDVTQVSDEAPEGYILEVDLEYPEYLHDTHKDLPLCPEHLTPPNSKLPKLMTTLYDKKRYIIHYRNLKQALSLGIKLTRIHRIIKFKQSDWLKVYIDLNTKLRTQSLNEFEKNLYKLY
ncbi:hypothetical protein NQ315_013520 [Exocentrus adspersus]|uniref:DNA-directed DNA polymerase n=1 Tax=Exocentrus adspersus TaxID=1586481 RepID=A0AAV8VB39_9CUCU|nr:hypothetical protein NQ315_013520 [Exocentrus adspersus]